MIKVAKFGGSSVAGAGQFEKVKRIIESDKDRKIVVVSAVGKTNSQDHKVTDLLYLCHAHLTYGVDCNDIFDTICKKIVGIRDSLKLSCKIEDDLEEVRAQLTKDISVDYLVSRGEFFTSKLMAEYLGFHFEDSKDCIFFDYDGSFDYEKTYSAINCAYNKYGNLVIPGFYGSLPNGKIRVMSRGGSDITGALAAVAINAGIYENWTDVSGILMADPRIVENPRPIDKITYSELREMAFSGASVLHEESILPVKEAGISLNIRNTNAPEDKGTMIVSKVEEDEKPDEKFITGIAGKKNYVILTVSKHNMVSTSVLRQVLQIMEKQNISVEHITLGLDSFALVISQATMGERMYDLIAEIRNSIVPDDIQIQDKISLVAAVGRKMTFRPGISGKLINALGENNVNVRTIVQAADELSIIVGVDNDQFESAVRVLYNSFASN